MNNFQIFLFLGILMMLLTILLYKNGWVKPVKPAESDSRPPIFWISDNGRRHARHHFFNQVDGMVIGEKGKVV